MYEQESPGWADLADEACDQGIANMMGSLDMDDPSEAQTGAAGCRGYQAASHERKRILDNLAALYVNIVFNGVVTSVVTPPAAANINTTISTSSGLSEDAINTLVEEGVGSQAGADDASVQVVPDAQDGVMWVLVASARSEHAGGETHVSGANLYNGTIFDSQSAITASDTIAAAFLAQFRAARVTFAETQEGLLLAMRTHTEWINRRDSRTQGLFVPCSHIGVGVNRDPATTGEDTELLMTQLFL